MSSATQQIERAIAKVRRVASLKGAEAGLDRASERLALDAAKYGAMRPGQTYVRTGAFGRGWQKVKAQRKGKGLMGGAVGQRPAIVFIIGTREQAAIHRDRWRTVKKIAEDNRDMVRSEVLSSLVADVRRR